MSEIRRAKGMRQLTEYRRGNASLSPMQSILACCAECCNEYSEGRRDCEVSSCPLHPYMPYNPNRRKGTRKFSDEEKAKRAERLKRLRTPS